MSFRVEFFDLWTAGYGGASVAVYVAGTDTLADLFYDEALTDEAGNPQTLSSMAAGGINYGKWARPLYVNSAYEMIVNSIDETGIIRPPLTTLVDIDGDGLLVIPTGGDTEVTLADFAGRWVFVADSGEFLPYPNPDASASTNSETLAAAIGRAAALGGGDVLLPAGTFVITDLSIPTGVRVVGSGRDVTVLQTQEASQICTFAGNRAGIARLTLDGVNKQVGSVGLYAKAKTELRLDDVLVKRFETGAHFQGGQRFDVKELYIDGCSTGFKGHGDVDASGDGLGDEFKYNRWIGGLVSNCTVLGVHLKYIDRKCWHNGLADVGFEDNTGTALKVEGARWTDLDADCWFRGNAIDLHLLDEATNVGSEANLLVGFRMKGGRIAGNMTFAGRCQDILFDRVDFQSGTYTLTAPSNNILALDCTETGLVALAGTDTTKWTRARSILGDAPGGTGVTTAAVAVVAWSYNLAPGERINVEAVIVANGRNTEDYAMYHKARAVHRPGSTLAYDNQTANFTAGDTITGGTSGASARVLADVDAGATGTLTLRDIVGIFQDNEIITGAIGGSAQVNGVLVPQNAVLLGATTDVQAEVESDAGFAAAFTVSVGAVRIEVTGVAAKTTEWVVSARVTSN